MASILALVVDAVVRIDAHAVDLVLAVRHPLSTKVMTSVTGLGSATAALVFLGVFSLAGWRDELLSAAVALAITGVVVGTLMATIQRPFPPQPVCLTGGADTVATSFPSGHAAAVTVFAMVASESGELPTSVVAVLAGTVAVSRVYLGTHYLSDTVAGVLIGVGAVLLARRVLATDWASRWLETGT